MKYIPEEKIRKIGFAGCDMNKNAFRWQMTCILLYNAIAEKLEKELMKYKGEDNS